MFFCPCIKSQQNTREVVSISTKLGVVTKVGVLFHNVIVQTSPSTNHLTLSAPVSSFNYLIKPSIRDSPTSTPPPGGL